MKYSVDRIEEGIAVCEDENGGMTTINVAQLGFDVKEGDIICKTDIGFELLPDETAEKKKRMANLQKSIFTKKG